MYLPNYFEGARDEDLIRAIGAFPLGALAVNGPDGLDANHIPFLVDQDDSDLEGGNRGKMTDSSPEYIEQMLSNIVGIGIEVTRMVGKWKPSQNREERDRIGAAEELHKRGDRMWRARCSRRSRRVRVTKSWHG